MTDEKREAVMDWLHVWTSLVIGFKAESLAANLVAQLTERDREANAFSVEDVSGSLDPAEQSLVIAERRLDHLERRLAAVSVERDLLVMDVVDQMARTLKVQRELERFMPAAREWGTALGQAMKRATCAEADARKAQAEKDQAVTAARNAREQADNIRVAWVSMADRWDKLNQDLEEMKAQRNDFAGVLERVANALGVSVEAIAEDPSVVLNARPGVAKWLAEQAGKVVTE